MSRWYLGLKVIRTTLYRNIASPDDVCLVTTGAEGGVQWETKLGKAQIGWQSLRCLT
jgi:hypothetical protein